MDWVWLSSVDKPNQKQSNWLSSVRFDWFGNRTHTEQEKMRWSWSLAQSHSCSIWFHCKTHPCVRLTMPGGEVAVVEVKICTVRQDQKSGRLILWINVYWAVTMRYSEFSDGGSEASLEDVRQHHGIIKTQKQDDPDYLTIFEAHQRRLEDAGSPTQGQGWSE